MLFHMMCWVRNYVHVDHIESLIVVFILKENFSCIVFVMFLFSQLVNSSHTENRIPILFKLDVMQPVPYCTCNAAAIDLHMLK